MRTPASALAVLFMIFSWPTYGAAIQSPPQAELINALDVDFSHPLTPEETIQLVKITGIEPTHLFYIAGEITGGYSLQRGEAIETAMLTFSQKHEEFLKNSIASTSAISSQHNTVDKKQALRIKRLNDSLRTALEDYENGNLQINSIRISGGRSSIESLLHLDLLKGFEFVFINHYVPRTRRDIKHSVEYSNSHEWWAPYSGTAKVSDTFAFHTFYFNYSFAGLQDPTYEHETQVDANFANYDYYWSSNLPRAYYDTPFDDPIDAFTVGSADALAIQTYTQYYTYMSLRRQNTTSYNVKIRGQLGYRYPSGCYSTWCIWALQTTYPHQIIQFTAPSSTTYSWSY